MARTIGTTNIRRVKALTNQCLEKGFTDIIRIEDAVIGVLGPDVMEIWESAHDEVRRIVGDVVMEAVHVNRKGL